MRNATQQPRARQNGWLAGSLSGCCLSECKFAGAKSGGVDRRGCATVGPSVIQGICRVPLLLRHLLVRSATVTDLFSAGNDELAPSLLAFLPVSPHPRHSNLYAIPNQMPNLGLKLSFSINADDVATEYEMSPSSREARRPGRVRAVAGLLVFCSISMPPVMMCLTEVPFT